MGNQASSERFYILLEQDKHDNGFIKAGTVLRGKVIIDVDDQIISSNRRNNKKKQLVIRIIGKEKSYVKKYTKSHFAQRGLLFCEKILHEFNNNNDETLYSGICEYPFEFLLPESLPSSFNKSSSVATSNSSASSNCLIKYKIVAAVRSLKSSTKGTYEQHYKTEKKFSIISSPKPFEIVPYITEVSDNIKSFGVQKVGTVTCAVSVKDTHCGRNEKIQVTIACRNESAVDIQRIYIEAVEEIKWWTLNGKDRKTSNVINDRRSLVPTLEMNIPAPSAKRDGQYHKKKFSNVVLGINEAMMDTHLNDMYADLKRGDNTVKIQIPNNTNDSYNGQLLSVSHSLQILVKTQSLAADPVIQIPLLICNYSSTVSQKQLRRSTSYDTDKNIGHNENVIYNPNCSLSSSTSSSSSHKVDICFMPPKISRELRSDKASTSSQKLLQQEEESLESIYLLGGYAKTMQTGESVVSDIEDIKESEKETDKLASPSLSALLEEMFASIYDLDIISAKLNDPEWQQNVFAGLTPDDFGSILLHVQLEHDQPKIAFMIASQCIIKNFTCEHCLAAIKATAEWNRVAMVQKLLPVCVDLEKNRFAITTELTPWELTVLLNDFKEALTN